MNVASHDICVHETTCKRVTLADCDQDEVVEIDGQRIQELAARTALGLVATTHEHPFGPDWDVFKVSGKVFLLLTEVPGEPVTIVKCDPDLAAALRGAHAEITTGYHMNKRHWITLHGGVALGPDPVEDLVCNSYRLVVAGLPRRARPRRLQPNRCGNNDCEK